MLAAEMTSKGILSPRCTPRQSRVSRSQRTAFRCSLSHHPPTRGVGAEERGSLRASSGLSSLLDDGGRRGRDRGGGGEVEVLIYRVDRVSVRIARRDGFVAEVGLRRAQEVLAVAIDPVTIEAGARGVDSGRLPLHIHASAEGRYANACPIRRHRRFTRDLAELYGCDGVTSRGCV